ncbi:hypothetical protein MBANPS3_003965 [Mucor bainieri]
MTKASSLPFEVLVRIFDKLDSLSQIAQCAMVCKALHDPAERVLFGRPLIIGSTATIHKLMIAFSHNPQKAKLIKHLKFEGCSAIAPEMLDIFLAFALTPSIESLTGMLHTHLANSILKHVKSWPPGTFRKIHTLSFYHDLAIEQYQEMSLLFCESIQTMHLCLDQDDDCWVLANVSKFKCLTHLDLTGYVGTIDVLDQILDSCPHLQQLILRDYAVDVGNPEVLAWDSSLTNKHCNLKTVVIEDEAGCSFAGILEFFMFKCPDMTKIAIDIELDEDYAESDIQHVGRIIRRVPQNSLRAIVTESLDVRTVLRYLGDHYKRILVDQLLIHRDIVCADTFVLSLVATEALKRKRGRPPVNATATATTPPPLSTRKSSSRIAHNTRKSTSAPDPEPTTRSSSRKRGRPSTYYPAHHEESDAKRKRESGRSTTTTTASAVGPKSPLSDEYEEQADEDEEEEEDEEVDVDQQDEKPVSALGEEDDGQESDRDDIGEAKVDCHGQLLEGKSKETAPYGLFN